MESNDLIVYGSLALFSGIASWAALNFKSAENNKKTSTSRNKQKLDILSRTIKEIKLAENTLLEEIILLNSPICNILPVPHLFHKDKNKDFPQIVSPLLGKSTYRSVYGGEGFLPEDSFVYKGSYVLSTANFGPKVSIADAKCWLRGGPRRHIFFNPKEVKAAIVTCGGLCPGLNVVIRELVMCLYYNYGVREIYGIKFGYRGFYSHEWEELTPGKVKQIHHLGGTMLGSSRGGFDLEKIMDNIRKRKINHLYLLGGDGTHAGIQKISAAALEEGMKLAICGLPKTIDNDIPIIDKSFGFETAVEEAQKAIMSAYVESHSAEFGVGLVRVMGRHAGFIAMEACNASLNVNVCLIPEIPFEVDGEKGLLNYVVKRLKKKGHCVIVVAEGANPKDLMLTSTDVIHGHQVLPEIGKFLKDQIEKKCKEEKIELTLKLIDPTYMVRTVPANSHDKKMCSQLAHNAAHGLMAGFSGFSVGHVNKAVAYIPIDEMLSGKYKNRVTFSDRPWQRLMAHTGQPSFINDEDKYVK